MIGDHAVRGALRPVRIDAREIGAGADKGAEKVDIVIVVHALQHGGDALKPHAGVDRGARQIDPLAVAGKVSNCMKTRFQISMNRSPSASGEPGGPPGM